MRKNLPLILVVLLVAGGLAVLFMLTRGAQEKRINHSVVGFALLAPWLESQDIQVEEATPRLAPRIDTLSLRILPLHDMDLMQDLPGGLSRRAQFYSGTLLDSDYGNFINKSYEMPMMVVLPKWVAGTFARQMMHESVLIPQAAYPGLLGQILLESGLELRRRGSGFRTESSDLGQVALFYPQVFAARTVPDFCTSLLDFGGDPLVLSCGLDTMPPLYLVADPDLMNNHGLTLGDNGAVVAGLLQGILDGDDRPVYLDTSSAIYTNSWDDSEDDDIERRDYERDSEAFARFFEQPFAALWAMILIVVGIAWWRGAVRFGPLAAVHSAGTGQSRQEAIATKARLLRLSGHDGQMVADFVRADLAQMARQIFGATPAGQARLFQHLARRDADLAQTLRQTAEDLIERAARMPHAELTRQLETYCSLSEKLTHGHDPDRVPKPR